MMYWQTTELGEVGNTCSFIVAHKCTARVTSPLKISSRTFEPHDLVANFISYNSRSEQTFGLRNCDMFATELYKVVAIHGKPPLE